MLSPPPDSAACMETAPPLASPHGVCSRNETARPFSGHLPSHPVPLQLPSGLRAAFTVRPPKPPTQPPSGVSLPSPPRRSGSGRQCQPAAAPCGAGVHLQLPQTPQGVLQVQTRLLPHAGGSLRHLCLHGEGTRCLGSSSVGPQTLAQLGVFPSLSLKGHVFLSPAASAPSHEEQQQLFTIAGRSPKQIMLICTSFLSSWAETEQQ